jgi:hypothetical protein
VELLTRGDWQRSPGQLWVRESSGISTLRSGEGGTDELGFVLYRRSFG